MTPDQLTQAIIQGINGGGEQFLEGTLAATLSIIWLAILGLHLGRPSILDMIDRFTLRLVCVRSFAMLLIHIGNDSRKRFVSWL